MKYQKIFLKDYFEELSNDSSSVECYFPSQITEMKRDTYKHPCLIICPGGGYHFCSQREKEPVAFKYLSEGFNVFVLEYMCAPTHFPAQMIEVAALMELIYKKSDEWNCNTNKIAIMGFSAGGHLAAQYALMNDCKEVKQVFEKTKPVNALILGYPVISADHTISHKGSFYNLLGHFPETKEEIDYFSCDKHVTKNAPPAFIWHTASDAGVPVENSLCLANAYSENKVPFELHIFPFGPHGRSTADSQSCDDVDEVLNHINQWVDESKKWLNLIFKL